VATIMLKEKEGKKLCLEWKYANCQMKSDVMWQILKVISSKGSSKEVHKKSLILLVIIQ
jgi:hypothetical protein